MSEEDLRCNPQFKEVGPEGLMFSSELDAAGTPVSLSKVKYGSLHDGLKGCCPRNKFIIENWSIKDQHKFAAHPMVIKMPSAKEFDLQMRIDSSCLAVMTEDTFSL